MKDEEFLKLRDMAVETEESRCKPPSLAVLAKMPSQYGSQDGAMSRMILGRKKEKEEIEEVKKKKKLENRSR